MSFFSGLLGSGAFGVAGLFLAKAKEKAKARAAARDRIVAPTPAITTMPDPVVTPADDFRGNFRRRAGQINADIAAQRRGIPGVR